MSYKAGTVTTVANNATITGTNTQWANTLYNVVKGQIIVITQGTNTDIYTIEEIKNNTSLVLSRPAVRSATNATYEILTTLNNSVSDDTIKLGNEIVAMSDFMRIMQAWTTGTSDTITVTWGSQQITMASVAGLQKQIDKGYGSVAGFIAANVHLDTIITPNFYAQNVSANAKLELGYPENVAGWLEVYREVGSRIRQVYTSYITLGQSWERLLNRNTGVSSEWAQIITGSETNKLIMGDTRFRKSFGLASENGKALALFNFDGDTPRTTVKVNNSQYQLSYPYLSAQSFAQYAVDAQYRNIYDYKSYFLEELTAARMGSSGVSDEYLILGPADPSSSRSNPTALMGTICGSRGNQSAGNGFWSYDLTYQNAYTSATFYCVRKQGNHSPFVSSHTATYRGRTILVLKLAPSGGEQVNGCLFKGLSIKQDGDVNWRQMENGYILSVVRQDSLSDIKDFGYISQAIDSKANTSFDSSVSIAADGSNLNLRNTNKDNGIYINYYNSDGVRRGFVGFGSNGNTNFSIVNDHVGKNITIGSSGFTYSGDRVMVSYKNRDGLIAEADGGANKVRALGFYYTDANATDFPNVSSAYGGLLVFGRDPSVSSTMVWSPDWSNRIFVRSARTSTTMNPWDEIYSTANTTKDAQGNLKASSPIVKVFANKYETNDESEGVEVTRLDKGVYLISGVLGLNSDESWGGIHGGIVVPRGINGHELVWVDYKVKSDGDIMLYTNYRKLPSDTPPQVVLNRITTYPEFMDNNGNEIASFAPCDIPDGHWVDVRVQMPAQSVFNKRMDTMYKFTVAQRLIEYQQSILNNTIKQLN